MEPIKTINRHFKMDCDKKNNKFEGEIMTIKPMKNQNE